VWLPETQIAPTMGSQATVPRPIAVVDAVNTASPATWWVSTDHLNRPVRMTDGAKASVWQATWKPFGEPQSITGSATMDARFPGQWFQLESGLHLNWWRHYDPTTGRYTQVDPLGFVDGPSVYGYARNSVLVFADADGRLVNPNPPPFPPQTPSKKRKKLPVPPGPGCTRDGYCTTCDSSGHCYRCDKNSNCEEINEPKVVPPPAPGDRICTAPDQ